MSIDMSQDSVMVGGVVIVAAVAPILFCLIKELNKLEENDEKLSR